MKRNFLLILAIAAAVCCIFALSVSAAEVQEYYLVQSTESEAAISLQAEGKTNIVAVTELLAENSTTAGAFFSSVADGDSITFTLAEDIVTDRGENKGILINKAITVTIIYNGYSHIVPNGNKNSGIFLKNANANLNLIGSHAIDENGFISDQFVSSTVVNGKITSKGNLDASHNKVYAWVYEGNVYAENMRTSTGQEFVYSESSAAGTYEFVSCACKSGSYSIGLQGQQAKTVKVENGYFVGLQAFTVKTGSYVKNATITGSGVTMDCWGISNNIWEFSNSSISKITTYTGRTHFKLIDCKIDPANFSLGSDGGGACYALVYTSPTCESDGTLNVYKQGKGATPVNNDSKYAALVTDYYADPQNKAFGHSYGWNYIFDGDKYLGTLTAQNACATCGNTVESVYVDAMFDTLGYSVPEFGTEFSITFGIKINDSAIDKYEKLTGATLNFGFVVAAKDCIGEGVCPLDEKGDAVKPENGNVIKADISNEGNAYADLKIALSQSYADTALLMSFYIIEAFEDEAQVSYAQANGLVENGDFAYVSYNNH